MPYTLQYLKSNLPYLKTLKQHLFQVKTPWIVSNKFYNTQVLQINLEPLKPVKSYVLKF